ncbi:MAG: hypothetical protein AAF957_24730 [Planctomycetota bacterium]
MNVRFLGVLLAASTLAWSCASTTVSTFASAEEATAAIVTAAANGNADEAERIFDSFARSSVQRDKVYATLYQAAEERYEAGRGQEASLILALVTKKYPKAAAAREALVYARFIERAESGSSSEESNREMRAAIDDLRASSGSAPPWVDLAETQLAIDEGDMDLAARSFETFLEGWNGQPESLALYVEDINRYLQSN